MFIIKVLGVWIIIQLLSTVRQITYGFILKKTTSTETDHHFELILAILFAAMIIREGLW